jgi:16S rRNA processing protein RimM
VRAVEDHGAGAFLVLDGPPERMLPFTRAVVPVVDIAGGRLVVALPDEIVVQPQAGDASGEGEDAA